jgi:hypothetical protein
LVLKSLKGYSCKKHDITCVVLAIKKPCIHRAYYF